MHHKAVGDAEDVKQPKEVERLQTAQEGAADPKGEVALVDAGFPVELVDADRLELGEEAEEDADVEVVAHVDPYHAEEGVVGADEPVVEVV